MVGNCCVSLPKNTSSVGEEGEVISLLDLCISSVSFFGVVGGHLASKQNGGLQDGRTFGSRRNTRLRTRHWRSCSGRAGLWDSTLRYMLLEESANIVHPPPPATCTHK